MLLAHHLHQLVVLQPAVPGNVADAPLVLTADIAGWDTIDNVDILSQSSLKVAAGKVFSLLAVRVQLLTYGTRVSSLVAGLWL